jgi:hypothetical protein
MASRVIGLSGPAGSGKSEAAKYLADVHGYTPVKFAGPLKDMVRAFYRAAGLTDEVEIERRIEGDLKEEPCPYLNGCTPRHAMQTLGTEWGRVCMGQNFWINAWARKVDSIAEPVVTDDCRFNNEAETVRAIGGDVVKLKPKVARRKGSTHVAEAGIGDDWVTHTIKNDGTIDELKGKILDYVWPPILMSELP